MTVYNFKKWDGTLYSDETTELIDWRYDSPHLFRESLTYSNPDYCSCLISCETHRRIRSTFASSKLIFDLDMFSNYLMWAQSTYIEFLDIQKDSLIPDFNEEDKGKLMLSRIKSELDSGNKLSSVSFKFNVGAKGIMPIKSRLMLKTIIDLLFQHYGINSKVSASDIQNDFLSKKLSQGAKFIRHLIVKELFTYLKKENPKVSENNLLHFIGEFLHLCQIPVSDNDNDLETFDISQMRHLLTETRNKY